MRVAFGDSVTFGQFCEEGRWTDLLGFVNKGVCGDTTRLALERFTEDVRSYIPELELVTIQFGFNDCNRWETDGGLHRVFFKAFRANLEELVYRVEEAGAQPVLISTHPTLKGGKYETIRLFYNDEIRFVAEFTGTELFQPEIEQKHLLDDIHLNQEGHRVFADQLAAVLP
jgi:lysophospholipase L1-like esterase